MAPAQNDPPLSPLVRSTSDPAQTVVPQLGISPAVRAALPAQAIGIAAKVDEFLQRKG
jgi:hypothetical protein